MKVLIIEDDPQIVESVILTFQIRWPDAEMLSTHQGEDGVDIVKKEDPDVVILDLGLPDIEGFEALKRIRKFSSVPVIILTVRAEESAVVKGLEWGADDYIVKPYRQLELMARVKALARRSGSFDEKDSIIIGNINLNSTTGRMTCDKKQINLTPIETSILVQLIKNAGRAVRQSQIAESVWGDDYPGFEERIKVYIRRIREKVEIDPNNPELIITRAGEGYLFLPPK
jgi:two-component system KDP operon response regulator KdpE